MARGRAPSKSASEDLTELSHRDRVRTTVLLVALVVVIVWAWWQLLHPEPPRHLVLASGPADGVYHRFALRYKELLGREGVRVEERMTSGAGDNLWLLLDRKSGVDIAFMQGGVVPPQEAGGLVMLASLYYEPLWIFYRDPASFGKLTQLRGKRIAVGAVGSGTRALVVQLLAANGLATDSGVARDSTQVVALGGDEALRALQGGSIDAALYVGGADAPAIQEALRDPAIKLMSLERADADARRFPFLTKLTLPAGIIDLAKNLPEHDVVMVGTKAMLAARDGLHPALIDLLLDAAREIHGQQGYFEAAGEFPSTSQLDIPVSADADQHKRFGPSFLHRYLPFWVASVVERAIILIVPLVVILIPLMNFLPQFMRWRVRSRIYRWYGELSLLEREVATRQGTLPTEQWLADLDRIERAVEGTRTPASFASEAYTLREHVGFVRRAVLAKASGVAPADENG